LGITTGMMLMHPYNTYRLTANTRYYMASPNYDEWMALYERFTPTDLHRLRKAISSYNFEPNHFTVLVDAKDYCDENAIVASLESIRQQHGCNIHTYVLLNDKEQLYKFGKLANELVTLICLND